MCDTELALTYMMWYVKDGWYKDRGAWTQSVRSEGYNREVVEKATIERQHQQSEDSYPKTSAS